MNPWNRGIAAVRDLCSLGLHPEALVPAVLEALHQVVPSYCNLFDWTDPSGRLLKYYYEGPIDTAIARLYFERFHNKLEADAMPPFAALPARQAGIHSASELDTPAFFGSALYHEIWRPQGLRWRVEAVLRGQRGGLLGSLVMYRAPGDTCFTAAEEQRLALVVPFFAAALQAAGPVPADARWRRRPEAEETLLLGLDGSLCHASPGAHRLLMLAQGGITPVGVAHPLSWLVHDATTQLLPRLREQVAQAQALGSLPTAAPPQCVLENAWGRFVITARLLQPLAPGQAALAQIGIVREEPHAVAQERALRGLPLTPGQRGVCRALLNGCTQTEIARQLGISVATVVDHVRKSYRTLDLRTAGELRALVDSRLA